MPPATASGGRALGVTYGGSGQCPATFGTGATGPVLTPPVPSADTIRLDINKADEPFLR